MVQDGREQSGGGREQEQHHPRRQDLRRLRGPPRRPGRLRRRQDLAGSHGIVLCCVVLELLRERACFGKSQFDLISSGKLNLAAVSFRSVSYDRAAACAL